MRRDATLPILNHCSTESQAPYHVCARVDHYHTRAPYVIGARCCGSSADRFRSTESLRG